MGVMRRIGVRLAALTALCGIVLGACGGSDEPSKERQEAAKARREADVSLSVRPILLAGDVSPGPVFSCTLDHGAEEVVRGPSAKTNLELARLVRSRQGICAVLTFPKVPASPSRILRITFYRDGDTSAAPENLSSGKPKHSVQITAYSDYSTGGAYLLSTSIPENGSSVGSVHAGRLGAAGRVVSILVSETKMPDWVFEKSTVWRAQIV